MLNGRLNYRKHIFRIGECKMMKKAVFIIIVFFATNCTSCSFKHYKDQWSDLVICASYAVPGMYYDDLKDNGVFCEVVETDSYGRILYQFEAENRLTENREMVYVVCQKNVSKYVYFYEDICYQFAQDDNNDLTELKERNDWECELNKEKMSRRESMITFDSFIMEDCDLDVNDVDKAGQRKFGVSYEKFDIISFLDADPEGKGMYLFSVEDGGNMKKYVAIVTTNYEISYIEAPTEIDPEVFAEFKKENDWKYGW